MHRALSAWNAVLNVLLYPSTWLHEQTHYVVLRPYVTDVDRDYAPMQSAAGLTVDVEGIPRWRYALGALAPTIIGVLCAIAAALVSVSGLAPPRGNLIGVLVLGAYWFTYTVPSGSDLAAALTAAGGGES